MSEHEKSSGSLSNSDSSEGSSFGSSLAYFSSGGSGGSGGSGVGCACLSNPAFNFGDNSLPTANRHYRTESILTGDAILTGVENDDSWVVVPESPASPEVSDGSVEFTVCNLSEIEIKISYVSEIAYSNYYEVFIDGVSSGPSFIINGAADLVSTITFDIHDFRCEHTIKVVGQTNITEDTMTGGMWGIGDKITFDVLGVSDNP